MTSWIRYFVGRCEHGYTSFLEEREIEKEWSSNVFYKTIVSNCPHCRGIEVVGWKELVVKEDGSE